MSILDDTTALESHLLMIGNDRALTASFKAQFPTLVSLFLELFTPTEGDQQIVMRDCPADVDITALQLTIFDNPRGNRWGANVRAYQTAPVKNWKKPDWNATIALWPLKDCVKKAKALRSTKLINPISERTVQLVSELAEAKGCGFIGILAHKRPGEGTHFHEEHVMWFDVDKHDHPTEAQMFSPECSITFPEFATTDAAGARLTNRAVAMSRHSEIDALGGWVTGKGTHLY